MKKYFYLLLLFPIFTFGARHNLIVRFSSETDVTAALSGLTVLEVRQIGSDPNYKVVIESDLSRQAVLDIVYDNAYVTGAETNQSSSIVELESAGHVDARSFTIVDARSFTDITGDGGFRQAMNLSVEDEAVAPEMFGQYHTLEVRAETCWAYTKGARTIVAVIDTGVDLEHEFLRDSLVPGYDFVDYDNVPDDEPLGLDTNENGIVDEGYGHGTHVAGIIKSVAPNVRIMPIRIADSDGFSDLASVVNGIAYAILAGADVINLSMSINDPSPLLEEWLELAKFANVVVVTSAGNDNNSNLKFPATESEVLTVASIDKSFKKAAYSNYSRLVDISAPGDQIMSCHPGDLYVYRSGTSMAAPVVAGAVALILDLVPGASVEYVHHKIRNKAKDIDSLNPAYRGKLGKGCVDGWNSITVSQQ